MKEQDLIDLGFERIDQSAEDSGYEAFHYYIYDFTKDLCLITCTNDEVRNKKSWFAEFFDYRYSIRFYDKEDVKALIKIINRNKI